MKSILNKVLLLSAITLSLSGCSDFLEKEPLSSGTEAIFFKTPKHFEQAANGLYNLEGWKDYNNGTTYYKMDQGMDISGLGSNGGASAPESNWQWGKPYEYIRNCNILLKKASEYSGDQAGIAHSVGTAYFFRAWQHYYLLKYFGGVPIVDHVVDLNDAVLQGPRNSRYEVAGFIISDLEKAIPLLTQEKNIGAADKGKVSKEAAKAFLARVLLYEATWEKYVPGIGFDLEGSAVADHGPDVGAGTKKPEGYLSINEMLTKAKTLSGEVITEAETGTYKLWNECDSLSYYYLFNLDSGDGNVANFKGAAKSSNKEFIFSVKYDYNLKRGGLNLGHTVTTWQAANISAYFGEMFLCRNGLPIRISKTGNLEDAENNPEFLGFNNFIDEYRNRDYRFIGCTYLPDRSRWTCRSEYGNPLTAAKMQPYPDPVYPAPSTSFDKSDPAHTNKDVIYTPMIGKNATHNGYGCRKFLIEGAGRPTETESPDYPLIRLAEVHLIYAEAACELNNGQISDADLDFSVNKNRARARVAPLTNALIANLWDAGWFDHAQGKTVCKKMNMLDEIRRERACELFGEGFREDDLKRWGIAHINLRGQKLGRHILGTAYETATVNSMEFFGSPAYDPVGRPLLYGMYSTDTGNADYGRPIANLPGNLLYSQRDYLKPIPLQQIRLNPQLKQNPGW